MIDHLGRNFDARLQFYGGADPWASVSIVTPDPKAKKVALA
jgi:hypothetical protein